MSSKGISSNLLKGLLIIVSILLIIVFTTIYVLSAFKQESVSEDQVNLQPDTVVSKQIDTSSWELYRDEEYGFEFKYPQNEPAYKNGPVKQYLDQDVSKGYYLTIATNSLKGQNFRITVEKISPELEILTYWKSKHEKEGFTFSSCDLIMCRGSYSAGGKELKFAPEKIIVFGQEGLLFKDSTDYPSSQKPLFSETVVIKFPSGQYILLVDKGHADITDSILSTVAFLN